MVDKKKVAEAMREVEEKSKAFTAAHHGESAEEILAQMRGIDNSDDALAEWTDEDDLRLNETIYLAENHIQLNAWDISWLKSLRTYPRKKHDNQCHDYYGDKYNPCADLGKAAKEYRNFREECGIKDRVMLNEIEEAYYEGAKCMLKQFEKVDGEAEGWFEHHDHEFMCGFRFYEPIELPCDVYVKRKED